MPQDDEIITDLPPGFVAEFADEILGTIPAEKVQVDLRQARNARIAQEIGSVNIPGLGQKIASIDPRLYFRLQHEYGEHEGWLQDFLADNPQLCCPGYKPRRSRSSALQHGKSFVDGKPV